MGDINPVTPKSTLSINGTNVPKKTQRLSEWIKKQDENICFL